MAKILAKKTPASKSAILLKNKELDKVKEKEKQEQLERQKQVITTVMESAPLETLEVLVIKLSVFILLWEMRLFRLISFVESETRLKSKFKAVKKQH